MRSAGRLVLIAPRQDGGGPQLPDQLDQPFNRRLQELFSLLDRRPGRIPLDTAGAL